MNRDIILNALLVWGTLFGMLAMIGAMLLLTGCVSETLAKGLTTKNVSGDGVVIDSHVGLDLDSKIPELRTVFISGDIATTKSGTNAISYREESSASFWNAKSITRKRFLSITLTDAGDVPAAIRAVGEVLLIVSETDKAGEERGEMKEER